MPGYKPYIYPHPLVSGGQTVFDPEDSMAVTRDELDPDKIPQFGLVTEELEKMDPDLVVRDADRKVNTVRYEAVNAMLLNEFLKEHRKIGALEAAMVSQQKEFQSAIAQQQKQIEALTAGLQKVNERFEKTTPAPPLLANSR